MNIQLISQNYLVAFYSIDNERKIANLADGEVTEEITNEKPAEKKKMREDKTLGRKKKLKYKKDKTDRHILTS